MQGEQHKFTMSVCAENLKFYICDEQGTTYTWLFAQSILKRHIGEHNFVALNEQEAYQLEPNANDVFVLDRFDGLVFTKLCATKALVLGPQCVIDCFMSNEAVPNNRSPVFTTAMRGLIVTLSGFSTIEKRELKKLIEFMGGHCIDELTENVTHLVTNHNKSGKFRQAALHNKKIMKSDWIHDVWEKSQAQRVHATSPIFDCHYLPLILNVLSPRKRTNEGTHDKAAKLRRVLDKAEYSKNIMPFHREEEKVCSSDESSNEMEHNFLKGKTVHLFGFNKDAFDSLTRDCLMGKAIMINDPNYRQVVDFVIVPANIRSIENIAIKGHNVVNQYWLFDARQHNKATTDCLPYYHLPIIVSGECKPLAGMVVTLSGFGYHEREFLHKLANILGARVKNSFRKVDRPLLIVDVQTYDTNIKYQAAMKWNFAVVNCQWLLACYKKERRFSVKNFLVGDSILPVEDFAYTPEVYEPSFEEEQQQPKIKSETVGRRAQDSRVQFDSIFTQTQVSPVEPQLFTVDIEEDANIRILGDFIKNRAKCAPVHTIGGSNFVFNEECKEPRNTEPIDVVVWGDRKDNTEMRYFTVLAKNAETKLRLTDAIRKLGARVCDSKGYDPQTTHLVCSHLGRGELTTCSIAGGKWVLHTEYIEKSAEVGKFVDEELYEWGNPKATFHLSSMTKEEESLVNVAHMSRKRVQKNAGAGIFKKMVVILRTFKNESFGNLIKAGHGTVVLDETSKLLGVQSDQRSIVTHIVRQSPYKLTAEDDKLIEALNLVVVDTNYLLNILLNKCIEA